MLIQAVSLTLSLALAPLAVTSERGALRPLVELSLERVRLAGKVAAAKWGTTQPIDDPARERQVLDDVAARSTTLGLDPAVTTRIFRDQIEASKLVQRALHARWRSHPGEQPTDRPDLAKEVRPHLDRITGELLLAIKGSERIRERPSCRRKLNRTTTKVIDDQDPGTLRTRGLTRALATFCERRPIGPNVRVAHAPNGQIAGGDTSAHPGADLRRARSKHPSFG
ncbi:chorismate mutase [Nonomuraea sp. NPDC059007]|uniref:chorismate mutase n=1 Tax=Nonomuraea sp. NPDC059007 TaxID=3346692 RepID=UPI003675E036